MSSLTTNKKIIIYRVAEPSEFSKKNAKVIPDGRSKIGSSYGAVKAMMVRNDMLEALMPSIIGVSSIQQDFVKRINNYWDSLSVNIPENGKELEIGFIYDLQASTKKKAIAELKGADGKPRTFTTEQQLSDYVEEFVPVDERWKYGHPIEPSDYLLYVYSLSYRDVANKPDEATLGKSKHIRFYIHNQEEIKKIEKRKFSMRRKASELFLKITAEPATIKTYLFAMGEGVSAVNMDEFDQAKLLETICQNDPAKIIAVSEDKQIKDRAFVEECITNGILRRLSHSDVIVNASDNEPIGNNMEDAIAFLNAEPNARVRNEIQGRLKALPKG